MTKPFAGYDLSVQYDTHDYTLSEATKQRFEEDLRRLADLVRDFPVAALHCEVAHHARSGDYHVKTSLWLQKSQPLFTAERAADPGSAFKRCVRKLMSKVGGYKAELEGERAGATTSLESASSVQAASRPPFEELDAAIERQDYRRFRELLGTSYSDSLSRRIGRWIERYPDATSRLGDDLLLSEVLEEVYLLAFESWESRAKAPESLGEWLETLIDPAIRTLLDDLSREKENLAFIQSWRESRA